MRTERMVMIAAAAAFLLLAAAGCGVDDDAPVLGSLPPTITITEVQVRGSTATSDTKIVFSVPTSDPTKVELDPISLPGSFKINFTRPLPYSAGQMQSATLRGTPPSVPVADLITVGVTYK